MNTSDENLRFALCQPVKRGQFKYYLEKKNVATITDLTAIMLPPEIVPCELV